ncbi:hypothetical protein M514_06785 [Trichuris suis]|uniref:Uncharacterized protein n=1 Tax=Trichuris suis TaxID=68888 RepID=A0A085M5A8_9BILA|nr:hypothetical protein M513_06785 [Trichuris suis]KFD69982.1 hypothetical protein M514_06785 [Trichuris suis]
MQWTIEAGWYTAFGQSSGNSIMTIRLQIQIALHLSTLHGDALPTRRFDLQVGLCSSANCASYDSKLFCRPAELSDPAVALIGKRSLVLSVNSTLGNSLIRLKDGQKEDSACGRI